MENTSEIKQPELNFIQTSSNAILSNWIISPLDYFYSDGRKLFDKIFTNAHTEELHDLIIPVFYKMTMQTDFRAKMMVLCYIKETCIPKLSLEIENGLLHFYGLDFVSTISQWIYVFEGILRDMFGLSGQSEITKHERWDQLDAINPEYQELLNAFVESIKNFTKNVLQLS